MLVLTNNFMVFPFSGFLRSDIYAQSFGLGAVELSAG